MADQIKRSCREILPDGNLPGDVMVSILIKLPIKSLLRFQAVKKSWCSCISSTHFFKIHLHRQSVVAPNHCLLALGNGPKDEDPELGLLDLTHHYDSPAADDDVLMLMDACILRYDLPLLDSCDGLVCMGGSFKTDCDVILWNPTTRRHRSLDAPKSDKGYTIYLDFPTLGLCYVDALDDFKILVWNSRHSLFTVDTPYLYVYSLSSDSWDEFEFYAPKTVIEFKSPTFMGTCMHWLSHTYRNGSNCTEIVVFDVINRATFCIDLPVICGHHPFEKQQTLVIGGCLSILICSGTDGDDFESGIGVWVMEEYVDEESWIKHYFVKRELRQLRFPIVSWNDGEILYHEGDDSKILIFYDLYSGNRRRVEFSSYHVLKFFKYVESLASVGTSLRCRRAF